MAAKVLTVSDGVVHGTREDRSGAALEARLADEGWMIAERAVCADGVESVAPASRAMAEAMRLVNPLGRLSRGVAGTVGTALVLNTFR